jgi:hypothetical protein
MNDSDLVELVRSNWGTKTLEAFRLESERHPEGGVFEAMRGPGGRRMIILLCATRPEDISRFVTMFSLVDDGVGNDWETTTLLDLLMGSEGKTGLGFSCLRDKDGRRRALIFLAHDPRSISMVERVFGLKP